MAETITGDQLNLILAIHNLLDEDQPIVIKPRLAKIIGLNEAIVLQQVKYWLKNSKHVYRDKKWIYNTYEDWEKQFPFWSIATIKRTFLNLESMGILESDVFNKEKRDRTKWYTIAQVVSHASDQIDTMEGIKLTPPLPETTTETSNKKGKYTSEVEEQIDFCYRLWLAYMVIDPQIRASGTIDEKRAALAAARKHTRLTELRKTKLASRLNDAGYDRVKLAIRNLSRSDFHRNGTEDSKWTAKLEWLCHSYEKVEEWANK